jgi:hypothetical protein
MGLRGRRCKRVSSACSHDAEDLTFQLIRLRVGNPLDGVDSRKGFITGQECTRRGKG